MKKNTWTRVVLLLYTVFMLLLLFGRKSHGVLGLSYRECLAANSNFIPLRSIGAELYVLAYRNDPYLIRYAVTNLFGNVLLFAPFGALLPLCFRRYRGFFKTVATGALAVFAVEILQLFTLRGCFDVDDLLLNTLGMMLGYGLLRLIKSIKKGRKTT